MESEDSFPESAEHVARVFHGLSEPRRVYAIQHLSSYDAGEEVSLREIAKVIAGREQGKPADQVDHPTYKSVRGSLHNWHLPTLDQIGIIDYDADRTNVQIKPELRFHRATLALVISWIHHQ